MTFTDDELTRDGFLGGQLQLFQPRHGYRAATDPVFLAAFAPVRPGERVLDLGCGVGTAGLCLARRVEGVELHGLEIQPPYAELARRNAAENGIAMCVHEGDLAKLPSELRQVSFHHVLMNPPFYRADDATGPGDPGRDTAHREGQVDLAGWIATGLRRLLPKGWLTIVHRVERLDDILAALSPQAGGIEILPLAPREGRPANRVLVRARKASAAPLRLHFPLVIHQGKRHEQDGNDFTGVVQDLLLGRMSVLID
ncbi:tRNA1(Val) (adenine(37)-N6)-methyltransferase [Amaricoccus macauensis]|uniref:tRNA1(Val) (adenine(37)-N6)-methyltransferase n=1 Tax=Amaricoccus macauensis TaxID=57001 RepID=UPI003C7B96E3